MLDRFRAVILTNTSDGRRWSELAAGSGIPATSWQKAYTGKQRPTVEMIEYVARSWPSYAYWLATGVTDARHGHVSCRDGKVGAFYPESDLRQIAARNAARPYFEQTVMMFRRVYGTGLALPTEEARSEEQLRLLTLMMTRNGEEAMLSQSEDPILSDEFEEANAHLRRIQQSRREAMLKGS